MTTLTSKAREELKGLIKGSILVPDDPCYEEARQIWNAMVDRRPAVIVQCVQADDIPPVIRFARKNGLELSIRGAGHNIAGNSLCDNGVTIDFSRMKNVRVDAVKRRAYVEPGATLANLDEATQAHGLATPVGINSTTGIAGLTLGGGFGWLTRKYGMTIDNLISVDVITAEGKKIRASENDNPDLFWAIRGGGGNFGVVTQFEFQLFPVGPEVVVLPIFYSGAVAEAEKLIAPVRAFGNAHGEHIGAQPYIAWQKAFDPLLTPGARNYWKSHNFTELADGALNTIIDFAGKLPSPQCEIFIGLIAGAPNRIAPEAMAYGHRDAKFVLNVHGRWDDAKDDQKCIGWAREFFNASAPYASAGAYVNFMTAEEGERVATAYGSNYDRLVEIKRRYDPENVFHLNQNIKP